MNDRYFGAANDNEEYRFYVYAWLYPDGQPFYVGKGSGRRDREPKGNPIVKNIVAKIRREGGSPRVVRWQDGLREGDAHALEMSYIRLFGRRDIGTGILANLTDGGEGQSGWVPSAEWRARMGELQRGKPKSEETKARMRASNLGQVRSDEARAKMSAAQRGKTISEDQKVKLSEASRGRMHSAETRAKIGATHAGREFSFEHRANISKAKRMAAPTSGYKGVCASGRKWRADILVGGKPKYLGAHATPEDAARAYDKAAVEAWGADNCYLNFPDEAA